MQFKPTHARSTNRQAGQGMSEYIIITALIAVAAIGTFGAFGSTIESQVSAMANAIAGDETNATQGTSDAGAASDTANQNSGTGEQDLDSYASDVQ